MINITFNPTQLKLDIRGHAGQDIEGKDIVCSATSMLYYTLAQSLNKSEEMLKRPCTIKINNGNGYVRCYPKKEYKANISLMYWTILNGIELLAEEYPQYIKFIVETQK